MENQEKVSLPNENYEVALRQVIEENLGKPIKEFNVIYSAGSAKGDGFAGELYRVKVNDKSSNETKLNLIVKLPPQSLVRREMFSSVIYEREVIFYNSVYPLFEKFQKEKEIDKNDGFFEVPKCYKTVNEALYLEDLKVLGFDLHDKQKPVTADHVFLVFKALAKLHALGYALKDQRPEEIEKYREMPEVFVIMNKFKNNPMDPWFEQSKVQTLEVVNKSDNPELIAKMRKFLNCKFSDHMNEIFDRAKAEPYATLCHGDCWTNNMMFRFDKNGVPKEIRLFDFQILRYFSPVADLVYYIFMSTEKPLRDKYYNQFMDTYHSELTSFIKKLGSDPEKLYPRHIFDQHLKDFGRFGLAMSVIAIAFLTNSKDNIPDFEKVAEEMKKANETGETNENTFAFAKASNFGVYEKRMMGVCEDMFNLGYI